MEKEERKRKRRSNDFLNRYCDASLSFIEIFSCMLLACLCPSQTQHDRLRLSEPHSAVIYDYRRKYDRYHGNKLYKDVDGGS